MSSVRRLLVLCVATLVLASCGTSGRELRPVSDDASGPERTTSSTVAPPPTDEGQLLPGDEVAAPAELLVLESPAWEPGGSIPVTYTCEGENLAPPLAWSGVPDDAASLALVVTDPDAGGFVHRVLTGLDPDRTTLDEGEVPDGAVDGRSSGGDGWIAFCPPPGEQHVYHFTLLVLPDGATVPDPDAEPTAAVGTLEDQAVLRALLTGSVTRDES
ncbi:MAG: YbhB/YbcL family Raf kinase inhibitor-like protein [Acidimicrobiia bacterium]|nr:YbhB/YbcL family Raf kinase inhibitor-like protein [Acidimicrobiia bacterium]